MRRKTFCSLALMIVTLSGCASQADKFNGEEKRVAKAVLALQQAIRDGDVRSYCKRVAILINDRRCSNHHARVDLFGKAAQQVLVKYPKIRDVILLNDKEASVILTKKGSAADRLLTVDFEKTGDEWTFSSTRI